MAIGNWFDKKDFPYAFFDREHINRETKVDMKYSKILGALAFFPFDANKAMFSIGGLFSVHVLHILPRCFVFYWSVSARLFLQTFPDYLFFTFISVYCSRTDLCVRLSVFLWTVLSLNYLDDLAKIWEIESYGHVLEHLDQRRLETCHWMAIGNWFDKNTSHANSLIGKYST